MVKKQRLIYTLKENETSGILNFLNPIVRAVEPEIAAGMGLAERVGERNGRGAEKTRAGSGKFTSDEGKWEAAISLLPHHCCSHPHRPALR